MEVTTVSPSAISPTEGDDLCETDVTNVAIDSVTLLIGLCGLAGNGAVLWLIVMNDITAFFFYLGIADFLFLLFTVSSTLLFLREDMSCSPIMPLMYVRFLFQLSVVSYYWGLFRLTRIRLATDMYKLLQLCCRRGLPRRLWWLVDGALDWAFYILITVIPAVTFLCPSHQQDVCRVSLISLYAIILLLFAAPVVIFRTIDFIEAKCGSQQQQPKRLDIVIFVTVLLILLLSLWNILQQLGYIVVPSHVVFLLTCINSSIKPFIYFLAGSSWRDCSVGRCCASVGRTHCTVGSLWDSLWDSLRRVFEESEENTRRSNDAAMDMEV